MVRTRFAPSPTGYLHIGGLRTALFAYLIAKSRGGRVILRLEDTDQKRLVPGAAEKLYDILKWCGLEFDEGPVAGGNYGPYVQSERRVIYDEYAAKLLDAGKVYRCFCTSDRLAKMREAQQAKNLPPRYDRTCRGLSEDNIKKRLKKGDPFVIRQKMPLTGEVKVHDELRGEIVFRAADLDDHVLIKSDGMPTYQFAIVVDDHLMEITHVNRGEEWISSFPKNILLYRDFGWTPPKFIHLPLTLNKGGGKLSKRQGDVAVEDYKDKGYLPEALINFSALLGWHAKGDREIFTLDELVKEFDIKGMGTSPAVFDIEKLDYLNGYYIRQKPPELLARLCRPFLAENLKQSGLAARQTDEYIAKVVALERERLKKLSDIGEMTEFFFVDNPEYEPDLLVWKKSTPEETRENLLMLINLLEKIPDQNWTNDSIEDAVMSYLNSRKQSGGVGDHLWPMRAALTGRQASPGPFEVAGVLGKAGSINRLKSAVKKLD
jgi:glutamyl-tRNA synthetase